MKPAGILILSLALGTPLQGRAQTTGERAAIGRVPGGAEFRGASALLEAGVLEGAFPGAVVVVGSHGQVVLLDAVGRYGIDDRRPVTANTIYDLASLTKVVGLTTAVMLLVADGTLDLDAPVVSYLPAFTGPDKQRVTLRHLLTHTSGLPAWRPLHLETATRQQALDTVFSSALETPPGERYVYSDLGAITLGQVVERVMGQPLNVLLQQRVFDPLHMTSTRYRPPADQRDRIAPTERDPWRGRLIRGEVHDENAARLEGVAGHAGLFGTGPDLARFAFWILDAYHGRLGTEHPVFVADTLVRAFTKRQQPRSSRALGWDTPSATGSSAGTRMSPSSFGHTGFTGTSVWIDPHEELFVILLTNRVHPTRENNRIRAYRRMLADTVVAAVKRR